MAKRTKVQAAAADLAEARRLAGTLAALLEAFGVSHSIGLAALGRLVATAIAGYHAGEGRDGIMRCRGAFVTYLDDILETATTQLEDEAATTSTTTTH